MKERSYQKVLGYFYYTISLFFLGFMIGNSEVIIATSSRVKFILYFLGVISLLICGIVFLCLSSEERKW